MKQAQQLPFSTAKAVQEWYLDTPEVTFGGSQRLQGRFREIGKSQTAMSAAIDRFGRDCLSVSAHGIFLNAEAADQLHLDAMVTFASALFPNETASRDSLQGATDEQSVRQQPSNEETKSGICSSTSAPGGASTFGVEPMAIHDRPSEVDDE